LEPGKLADFIVLSENPFEVKPERISEIKICLTVIGGKIVYESQLK
jgi:predicted amidohydrolase YtcJ